MGCMCMVIANNIAAMTILNESNKNLNKVSKILKQITTGEFVNSAADDASEYSIAARMKVRLRVLNQDDQNVQNGEAMLKVAEGAIQSQIDLMRTIKERVINAHNDTNTDMDRQTIQKEITQYYDEIDKIAAETNFNGVYLLNGGTVTDTVADWIVMDNATEVEGSKGAKKLIDPAPYSTLDGVDGPFDVFQSWNANEVKKLDFKTDGPYGTGSYREVYELDLGIYNGHISDLEGEGIRFLKSVDKSDKNAYYDVADDFVLTFVPGTKSYGVKELDISGCDTVEKISARIAEKLNEYVKQNTSILFAAKSSGAKVIFQSMLDEDAADDYAVVKFHDDATTFGGDVPKTGVFSSPKYLSGGVDAYGIDNDKDNQKVEAKLASLKIDFSKAKPGTGITIKYGAYTIYVVFKEGDEGFVETERGRDNRYFYTVGNSATSDCPLTDAIKKNISLKNGVLTIKAPGMGAGYNYPNSNYRVDDGIKGGYWDEIKDDLNFYHNTTQAYNAKTGTAARKTIDLAEVTKFIPASKKAEVVYNYFINHAVKYGNSNYYYEFIDSSSPDTLESIPKYGMFNGVTYIPSNRIDLKQMQDDLLNDTSGRPIEEVAAEYLAKKLNVPGTDLNGRVSSSGTQLIFESMLKGEKGTNGYTDLLGNVTNNMYVGLYSGNMTHYTIDIGGAYADYDFDNMTDEEIEEWQENLDNTGFRYYCATDSAQWFNIMFINGEEPIDEDRPASGTEGEDIKSIYIDISDVKNAEDLASEIYKQATPVLNQKEFDHYYKLALDKNDAGKLIVYDNRPYTFLDGGGKPFQAYHDYQEKGAKIADGILDNVVRGEREIKVKRIIIHHTDESSNNIKLDIPSTSLDKIFGMVPNYETLDRYNVMTESNRIRLLGRVGKKDGALDKAIQYLTDAETLIGAQTNHLRSADDNIIILKENTTAAKSVLTDTDMAKAMLEYTKGKILSEAATSMMSNTNRNMQDVMNLLQ